MVSKTAKFLVVFCLLSVVCLSGARADDNHMLPMLRMGVDARALGMGGAYVAEAADASAGYWNPAGLAYIERGSVTSMYSHEMSFDRAHNYFAFGYTFNGVSAGISWLNAGIKDIPEYDGNDNYLGDFKDENNVFLFSLATKVRDGDFAVGANFKIVSMKVNTSDDYSKTGVGADVGVRYAPAGAKYAAGLAVRNLGTKVDDWTAPTEIQLGAVLYPYEGVVIPFDIAKTVNRSGQTYHLGGEYFLTLNENFAFVPRAGVNDGAPAVGTGFAFTGENLTVRFDYTYVTEREDFMNQNHKFSLSAEF